MTRAEMRKVRLQLVHQMHEYILNVGDEDIYDIWFTNCVPDNPSEEDFEFFADDPENFRDLCEIFGAMVCRDERENY